MIEQAILDKANEWLNGNYDEETKAAIRSMMDSDPKELTDSFYQSLSFGTGGMRGIMGPGTNRINKYTLGMATQGLSNYLIQCFPNEELKVAIAYDCRNNSGTFARQVAEVFSANGIKVYLFESLRPTPELSFTIRHLGCHSGIVLTASHNPKEYNGYKVYWNDGAQIVRPHDKKIIEEVQKITNPDQVKFEGNEGLIEIIGAEVDRVFHEASVAQGFDVRGKDEFKVVFTSIHGTSIKGVPQVLGMAGFRNVYIVEEQAVPNGNFPTVDSPNPEEPEALSMALDLADEKGADMVIGTDPDSDRIGIAVRDDQGKLRLLNGNQTGAVMTDYLIDQWKKTGKLEGNEFVASTIVTSELFIDIAAANGLECPVCLTGFKWIAELIREREGKKTFIGGGEESFGYMVGDFVRDKDAVTSALIACEIGAEAQSRGSSFFDRLLDVYMKYGFYKERLISIVKKGRDGAAEIKAMMDEYRTNPPATINGSKVVRMLDYASLEEKGLMNGTTSAIDLPSSNVLQFYTEDGSKISARPSGTEPKIKFYFSVKGSLSDKKNFGAVEAALESRIDAIIADLGF
ncbi:MAG: phospho-sugar mutase [Flavobacteriales bacterium]|nr:phospho-sugar mutase [Flavobacteriales bacterium]